MLITLNNIVMHMLFRTSENQYHQVSSQTDWWYVLYFWNLPTLDNEGFSCVVRMRPHPHTPRKKQICLTFQGRVASQISGTRSQLSIRQRPLSLQQETPQYVAPRLRLEPFGEWCKFVTEIVIWHTRKDTYSIIADSSFGHFARAWFWIRTILNTWIIWKCI